jgi:hypothetical protein
MACLCYVVVRNKSFCSFFPFAREIGKYSGRNRHDYLLEPLVVVKYASSSGAHPSLLAMSIPTYQQMKDMVTLNKLPEYIVNAYCAGDFVLNAMNQPTTICIGHTDFVKLCLFVCFVFSGGGGLWRSGMVDIYAKRFLMAFSRGLL